ncbi:MAG: histidinol-phosphate transaminase [Tissierellia bacterium]|nr:histidinol-phosphate transaminase [Tissierellia bacterium]
MKKKDKHGANLFDLQRKYGFAPEEIMDFSSNINPLGPSSLALSHLKEELDKVSVYPDPDYVKLKKAIGTYAHCQEDSIVLGSGTTHLIADYIRIIGPKRALLNSPCYSEYQNELEKQGSMIYYYDLDYSKDFVIDVEEVITYIRKHNIDLYVLTNPNNPTGTILTIEEIQKILEETGVKMLIDETYIEFTDIEKYSCTTLAQSHPGLLVVRSTSKFFSTPGIRLGYGIISHDEVKQEMNQNFNLWSINIFADILGQYMFYDKEYQNNVYEHIQREKDRMVKSLSSLKDIKVYPSYGNFVLCQILKDGVTAKELRETLLPHKMVIRDCVTFKNLDSSFFRFCILSTKANEKLLHHLLQIFND